MSEKLTREYYRIRFPKKSGTYGEWHSSNNGTSEWPTMTKIKAILSFGIRCGFRGHIRGDFKDYEVVKFVEQIERTSEVVETDIKE